MEYYNIMLLMIIYANYAWIKSIILKRPDAHYLLNTIGKLDSKCRHH